jgi:hypothetical protein
MRFSSGRMNPDLNIYDTKTIRCIECDKPIGEIDYDANVIHPICGQCDDLRSYVKDKLSYRMKITTNQKLVKPIQM